MHVHSGDGGGCICVRMPLLSGVRVLGTGAGGGGVAEVTGVGLDCAVERRQRAVGLTESWSRSQRGWQGTTRARAHKDTQGLSVEPQHLQGAPGGREGVRVRVSVPGRVDAAAHGMLRANHDHRSAEQEVPYQGPRPGRRRRRQRWRWQRTGRQPSSSQVGWRPRSSSRT